MNRKTHRTLFNESNESPVESSTVSSVDSPVDSSVDSPVDSSRNASSNASVKPTHAHNAHAASGVLYVVATPIGNLEDITLRAIAVLRDAKLILAEDTRRSMILLQRYAIQTPLTSFHQHNEAQQTRAVLDKLQGGATIALISDAGTPLISDPGHPLVRDARRAGLQVTPLPGANAAVAALSACGLPVARFCFEGFLPSKASMRLRALQALRFESRTMVFYESAQRIKKTLAAMREVFGAARPACLAREISKRFETFYCGNLGEIIDALDNEKSCQGEMVVIVQGDDGVRSLDEARAREVMEMLCEQMPRKHAAKLAARLLDASPNALYALGLKSPDDSQ